MTQFVIKEQTITDSYATSLKLLILQQLHYTLYDFMDNLGLKFEVNNLGIINMSWTNIIEPKLDKY